MFDWPVALASLIAETDICAYWIPISSVPHSPKVLPSKPTNEELCTLYENVKNEWVLLDMRETRNMLLSSSDFRVVSDYPNRDKWLIYRQKLRDLPINWTPETPFPEEPN